MKSKFDTQNPSTQLIVSFIVIVLLTAAIVGLPSIWILQNQLDQQAWAQVEQGQRAAIALHSAQYHEILNLATLTAQRPTLKTLLAADDTQGLLEYLEMLRDGAGLTRIIVCDPQDQIIVTTDEAVPETICSKWKSGNYQYNPEIPQACLTAHQPILSDIGVPLGDVFVCNQLDDAFAMEISAETGLEHTIWIDDVPVSTSFSVGPAELAQQYHTVVLQEGRTSHHTFDVSGVSYYSAHLPLESAGLGAEVALDITELQTIRAQSTRILVGSLLLAAFIGTITGVLLIRRICRAT